MSLGSPIGNNIICQRYFRISNFNPHSLCSYELSDVIRSCGMMIDNDLKQKTQTYLEIFAPKYFNSIKQMNKYFESEYHRSEMRPGYAIVINGVENAYIWSKNGEPVPTNFRFDDGELFRGLSNDDRVDYKFAFLVDGREVCSTVWEGVYPKYIRRSIDLSNSKGKLSPDRIYTVGFDEYLNAKLVEGKNDLVWKLIRNICNVCSNSSDWYSTVDTYGNTIYSNYFDAKEFWRKDNDDEQKTDSKVKTKK